MREVALRGRRDIDDDEPTQGSRAIPVCVNNKQNPLPFLRVGVAPFQISTSYSFKYSNFNFKDQGVRLAPKRSVEIEVTKDSRPRVLN